MSVEGSAVVPAGSFGVWLSGMRAVLRGQCEADVPCGDCVGCCVSTYMIPLRPDDSQVLGSVPDRYLMIERQGAGIRYQMKPREDGTCPVFNDGGCSLYAHRPQTCRDYDCRVYSATGLVPDGDRPVIRERVEAWRFSYSSETELADARAIRSAAAFLLANRAAFPPGFRMESAAAAAVLAMKVYPVFREGRDQGIPEHTVARILEALRQFDSGKD